MKPEINHCTNTTRVPFDEIYENSFFVQKVAGMCSVLMHIRILE